MKYYIYEHIRPDTGKIFYVGKGSKYRYKVTQGRNCHWQHIVAKAGGFEARIVVDDLDEEFALFIEEERIDQLQRLGYTLANMSSGGETPSFSDEAKLKMSESHLGEKNPRYNVNSKRQQKLRGEIPHVDKEVMKANMRANHWSKTGNYTPAKGRVMSEETRQRMSESAKKRVEKKPLKVMKGENHPSYGRKHTAEELEKQKEWARNRPVETCPHCGKVGKKLGGMLKHHFDNCKKKGDNND